MSEQIFLGVDLGWTTGATGLALLHQTGAGVRLSVTVLARTHDETLEWIVRTTGDSPAILAIDAPTIIHNPKGQRPGERQLNAVFRKHLLNCHPANLGRPFAPLTTAFANKLEAFGFAHAPTIEPRRPGRYQIEVFPHGSIVRLFNLEHRIRYKKGTVAERAAQLRILREHIATLRHADPPLFAPELPAPDGAKGRERKHIEDRLDAIVCAYTAAYYWFWGAERNDVFGDLETGYLVVPRPPDPLPARAARHDNRR